MKKNFGQTVIDIISGGFLKGVEGILDEIDISKDKKDQARLKMRKQEIELQLQLADLEFQRMQEYLEDRAGARTLYGKDAQVQKIYAVTFLIGYLVLTIGLILLVFNIAKIDLEIPDWGIATIGSIWGGMTSKVNTITDFFFGSSQGSKEKNELMKIEKSKEP